MSYCNDCKTRDDHVEQLARELTRVRTEYADIVRHFGNLFSAIKYAAFGHRDHLTDGQLLESIGNMRSELARVTAELLKTQAYLEHMKNRSVTELCADHPNLREYIGQLEGERDAALSEKSYLYLTRELVKVTGQRDEAQKDTERLDFLLPFLVVDDVGDDTFCPGIVVDPDAIGDAISKGIDELDYSLCGGFAGNMRDVIDRAKQLTEGKT